MSSVRMNDPSEKHIENVQVKPLLKRVSRDVSPSTSIDLSRSSFEQEGLGIYTSFERDNVQTDLYTNFPTRRKLSDLHRRSTSGTSQLSTASSSSIGNSSMGKPRSQYVHPMRRAPRAYTPPLVSHARQNSYFERDGSQREEASEGDFLASETPEIKGQYVSPSILRPRLSLHLPESSFTPLPGASQTNLTGRASFGYSRDNASALDTTSPTSRPSLDFVFRSRTRTSMDPVSRAATVQAARQAFEEKEAAKSRKIEEQRIKAEEKQLKRKQKHGQRMPIRNANMQEKVSNYSTCDIHHRPQSAPPLPTSENWKSQSKSTWMLFLTWLRTRIFKFGKKVRSTG